MASTSTKVAPPAFAQLADGSQIQPLRWPWHLGTALCLLAGIGLLDWWYRVAVIQPDTEAAQWIITGAITLLGAMAVILIVIRGWHKSAARISAANFTNALAHPTAKRRALIALVLLLLSANFFYFTAQQQKRILVPVFHDESMYLLQARMLSEGHLWLPPHKYPQFFETFHVLTEPVYAPIYFYGCALVYVPGVWAGMPPYFTSILITGLAVALLYLVITRLLNGIAGLLAAMLLVSNVQIRFLSIMTMSHTVVLMLALAMIWAWLNWRQQLAAAPSSERKWKLLAWSLAMGLFAGWAAVTRPIDALCYAAPLALAVLLDLWRAHWRFAWFTLPIALLTLAPFIAVQLHFDKAVTGRYLEDPATYYAQINWPALRFGLPRVDPNFRPPSHLLQFQEYYGGFVRMMNEFGRDHIWQAWYEKRFPQTIEATLPFAPVLLLAVVGILALFRRHRDRKSLPPRWWIMPIAFALFCGIYTAYPAFLKHYPAVVAPAIVLLVLLGCKMGIDLTPLRGRWITSVILGCLLIGAGLSNWPQINRYAHDPAPDGRFLQTVNTEMDKIAQVGYPALVLFSCEPNSIPYMVHSEPVYNLDVSNPDDAMVIRARDLGPAEDAKLFAYYAAKDPTRRVYLFKYSTSQFDLIPIGTVGDLANAAHLSHP